MGMGKLVSGLLGDPNPADVRQANTSRYLNGRPLPPPAKDPEQERHELAQFVQDQTDQSPGFYDLEGIAKQAVENFGVEDAAARANQALFSSLMAEGRKTISLRNTVTGKAPTVKVPGAVFSNVMGMGGNTAISYVTPDALLQNFAGPEQAKVLRDRLASRNLPYGEKGAAVYHTGNFERDQQIPWLIARDLKDGFEEHMDGRGTVAYINPLTRTGFWNAGQDPDFTHPGWMGTLPMNVGQHEAVHTVLHGQPVSAEFTEWGKNRPAIAGVNRHNLHTHDANYLSSNSDELGNLLFHLKRLTEISHKGMRDVGKNQQTLNDWLDFIGQHQRQHVDPVIDLPGHPREGQRAHGFEEQADTLQEILRNLDPDAKADLDKLNFDTSQTPSLRKSLLA